MSSREFSLFFGGYERIRLYIILFLFITLQIFIKKFLIRWLFFSFRYWSCLLIRISPKFDFLIPRIFGIKDIEVSKFLISMNFELPRGFILVHLYQLYGDEQVSLLNLWFLPLLSLIVNRFYTLKYLSPLLDQVDGRQNFLFIIYFITLKYLFHHFSPKSNF